MHKSKLELYGEVLQALTKRSLTIDRIAFECNMDCVVLTQRLTFLAKNDLIQECTFQNKIAYALTRRGLTVSKTLAVTKRLEKLQVTAESPK
jgi:predicted transcriptional regulator